MVGMSIKRAISGRIIPAAKTTAQYKRSAVNPAINPAINETENALVERIEAQALFEEFQQEVLPALREMVKDGAKTEEILEVGRALAAARLITIAATDKSQIAMTAIKEILERKDGKVADKKQIEHRLAKMDDKELDAYLISKMSGEDEEEDEG